MFNPSDFLKGAIPGINKKMLMDMAKELQHLPEIKELFKQMQTHDDFQETVDADYEELMTIINNIHTPEKSK